MPLSGARRADGGAGGLAVCSGTSARGTSSSRPSLIPAVLALRQGHFHADRRAAQREATNSPFHLKRSDHGRSQAGRKKLRHLDQGRAALPEAHQAGAGALRPAAFQGLRRLRGGPQREARRAHGRLVALARVRDRFRAALDPVLGHAARARQQLRRAQPRGPAAAPALRLRNRRRRTHARPSGQLRAGAHRPAGGRDGRSEAAALRDHRPARRPRPGHRRLQGRFAGRRRAARGPSGLLRDLLPRSGAGPDPARRLRCRAAIREESARAASDEREAGDRRQLPGRLGGDDARRGGSGGHRARS